MYKRQGISTALNKLKAGFSDYGKQIGAAFNEAYDAEMSEAAKKEAAEKAKGKKTAPNGTGAAVPSVAVPTVDPTAGSLNTVTTSGSGTGDSGSGKIRNVTINIEKLVERIELHTATISEGTEQIKERVLEALMGALNDTQLATE